MNRYSTVFLDWNKTLSHSKFWGHWVDEQHPQHSTFKDIQHSLFSIDSLIIQDWMRGKHTSEDIVKLVANQTKIDYKFLFEEFKFSCEQMEFSSINIPKLVKQLQEQNIKVIIATDNMDSFNRWTVPALKLPEIFDDIINSYNLTALKTDVDNTGESIFFKKYLSDKNPTPENCVLIDDHLETENIINKSGINFLLVSEEQDLEKHLTNLLKD